ncbi:hypothetical protein SE17_10745 [Kouleothrix aurantiaca]|uniref:NAD-dependent epimerase/dehydratase domain-containing protein n=1 Tax=Kouleothrix aurantiaca TaxID=186479 RepID=A0A0P9D602_9CHLR|nr:hypothetical protein SE17_10745 [Kouleothrix aurantiaca]
MTQKRALVTDGAGFTAGHCIFHLLQRDDTVRTTTRSLGKEAARADAGMTEGEELGFAAADLLSDEGWAADVADVDCVLHVANKDDMTVRVKEHCVCCARRMDLYFNEDPLFPA